MIRKWIIFLGGLKRGNGICVSAFWTSFEVEEMQFNVYTTK